MIHATSPAATEQMALKKSLSMIAMIPALREIAAKMIAISERKTQAAMLTTMPAILLILSMIL